MNVLIVDDVPMNLKLLGAILEAEGHRVIDAHDGVEAMEILGREKIDAIISDILMPRMDGYRLCYEVRASNKFHHLPFIFHTSSYTSPADEKLAIDMGGDKFLTKPAPAAEVIEALRAATSAHRAPVVQTGPVRELTLMKEYNQQLVGKLEEKNAELTVRNEELHAMHAQVQHLLDHSPAVLYQLRMEGDAPVPVLISDTVQRMLGYNPEECLANDWWLTILHPDERNKVVSDVARALKEGGYSGEYRVRHKDGTYRWVADHNRVVSSSGKGTRDVFGAWSDITERKRAEEVLQGTSEREEARRDRRVRLDAALLVAFGLVVFAVGAVTGLFDRAFLYFVREDAGKSLVDELVGTMAFLSLGLLAFSYRRWKESREELGSQTQITSALRVLHGELERRIQERTEQLLKTNEALHAENAERKRAEQTVQRQEEQLRLCIEHSPAAIAMLDRNMNYLHVSQRWLTDYRLTGRKIIGRCHYDLFPDWPEHWKEIHQRCLAGAIEKCDGEKFSHADGSVDWIQWEIRPWRDRNGEVGGLVIFAEVLTQRREAQAKIESQLSELQRWREVTLNREDRVQALKSEVNEALALAGKPPRYAAV